MRSIKVSQSEKGRWGAGVSTSRQRGGLTRPQLGADRPRAYSGRGRRTAARITGISVSVCVFKKGWENPQMGLMCIMNEMMRTKPSAGNSEQSKCSKRLHWQFLLILPVLKQANIRRIIRV